MNDNKNVYQHNFRSFNQQIFLDDIQTGTTFLSFKRDVDNSFNKFFVMIEMLLDTYAPIQKLTKAELKLKSKPWLARGIIASIKRKI